MKKSILLSIFFLAVTAFCHSVSLTASEASAPKYPSWLQDRWFYSSLSVHSEEQTAELIQVLQTAEKTDLNGLLWATGFESCGSWSPAVRERFARVKAAADKAKIEIIPIIWSVGYGTMLGKNPNLIESTPIKKLRVTVENDAVKLADDENIAVPNGGFEEFNGDKLANFNFADQPGLIAFRDTEVKRSGNSSIRLENFTANSHGHGRVMKTIDVTPFRSYRLKIWFKTENLRGSQPLRFQIYGPRDAWTSYVPSLNESGSHDWTEVSLSFTAGDVSQIRFYAGVWDGKEGKVWLDDLSIESCSLTAPVMRPGTPLSVKNAKTGKRYQINRDYVPKPLNIGAFRRGETQSPITIPKGSRIKEGDSLLLSYYVPIFTHQGQTSVCMSEPELYQHFDASAKEIVKLLNPKKWFLSMDEIRAANTCKACAKRNLSLGEILGDCLTKQYQIIQKHQPGAQVYVWSDMLDPKHNCHADYMQCRGDFTGVWDHIPKELIISCWYFQIREDSMKFFSEKGFRTQAAAYYDKDDNPNWNAWLETCAKTPDCTGIMYTTWRKKFNLLVPFADDVKKHRDSK